MCDLQMQDHQEVERRGGLCDVLLCRTSRRKGCEARHRIRVMRCSQSRNLSSRNLVELPKSVPKRVCNLDVSHNRISDWERVRELSRTYFFYF